jgi:hypothetical protein
MDYEPGGPERRSVEGLLPILFLLEKEGSRRAVAVDVAATAQRTNLAVAKESRTCVRAQDFLKQTGIMTFSSKQTRPPP